MSSEAPQVEMLPWFWATAPMPRPALWQLRDGVLLQLPSGEPAPADRAVLAALGNAEAGARDCSRPVLLAVRDAADRLWRLKSHKLPDGSLLWLTQELERTRVLLFGELRAALAAILISPIRHELSGTVQTLSLSADIAGRLLDSGAAGDGRLAENLEVIRRRLLELHRRQTDMLELWLSDPAKAGPPAELKTVLEAVVGLLKSHLAIAGTQLVVDDLAVLEGTMLGGAPGYASIGMLALLLLLGPQPVQRPPAEKRRQTLAVKLTSTEPPTLELESKPRRGELPPFAGMEGVTALAAIAALLDAAGLELSPPGTDGVIRLRLRTDIDADYAR
jgi:hypothetical protein